MKTLIVSFSGGRTSAYLTLAMWTLWKPFFSDIRVIFANTGEEHPETLRFVHRFSRHYGIPVTWVEAEVVLASGVGTQAKVVDYLTATRPNAVGGPYEQVIRKYGIPNQSFPNCTRELKQRPLTKYVRNDLGLKSGEYQMAIGIRADEIDRISVSAKENSIIYPLIGMNVKKPDILRFWSRQPIDLEIPEHMGNCLWCWKKSARKLRLVGSEMPSAFDFPRRMEVTYSLVGPEKDKGDGRRFFRGRKLAIDAMRDPSDDDLPGGCGSESCEVFTGETDE